MAKSVTVNFDDGSSHTYDNVPDQISDDEITQRAGQDFSDKTISNIGGDQGQPTVDTTGTAGPVAPTDPSMGEKIAGGVATAANLAAQHPVATATAAGLYKANKVANTWIDKTRMETQAAQDIAKQRAETAAAHQNIQQQKINLRAGQPINGPVEPQIVNPQGEPINSTRTPTATQAAPAAAAEGELGTMNAARNIVQKLALDKVMKGAGLLGAGALIGSQLMYTSPEEIAVLKAAEAKRRAQGWKPLNER
jgi:hypothetical protein